MATRKDFRWLRRARQPAITNANTNQKRSTNITTTIITAAGSENACGVAWGGYGDDTKWVPGGFFARVLRLLRKARRSDLIPSLSAC